MTATNVKLFFLVAGHEYSEKDLDFWKMCTGRVRERIQHINTTFSRADALVSADTTLRFIRFNVGTGKIEVIDRDFTAGRGVKGAFPRESDWKPLSTVATGDNFDPAKFVSGGPFRAISNSTDYQPHPGGEPTFISGAAAADVISITDVYRSVRGAPPGSVLELSFFSHGWIEGPILVNSSDAVRNPNLRDPNDKDGRSGVDFNLLMGEASSPSSLLNGLAFTAAFDPKGAMHTWGCNFDIELRVVQQAQTRIKQGGVNDATPINFHFEDWAPARYTLVDPGATFLPPVATTVNMTRTFGEVKKFLRRRLQKCYAFQFANNMSHTGVGALPGTEGDDEKTGFRMMQVCAKFDPPACPVGFANLFAFYRTHLGIKVDNRGYGILDAATMQKLLADIAADGP